MPESLASTLARRTSLRWMAIGFVTIFTLMRWAPATGFTALIRFGDAFAARRLPELAAVPIAPSPGDGYDGQFYAQLAVDPHVTRPAVITALDKPAYRSRRILLPWIAHAIGLGSPRRILQAYALLNLAAWFALAGLFWTILPADHWRPAVAWFGCVLGVGALDSVRMSLTDLPAALCLAAAIACLEANRPWLAVGWSLAAGFVREVSILGLAALRDPSDPTPSGRRPASLIQRLAVLFPVAVWCLWLTLRLPGPVGHEGNFAWPGVAFAIQEWRNLALLVARGADPQWAFGLIGGIGLAAQSVFLLTRLRRFGAEPWLRLGIPFAVLFWCIGADPWWDYRAVARDCLPMTLAFNVLWARDRSSSALWLLCNGIVVDGVLRMTWP